MEVNLIMSEKAFLEPAALTVAKDSLVGYRSCVSSVQLATSPHDKSLYVAITTNGNQASYYNPTASFNRDDAQFGALMKAVAERALLDRFNHTIRKKAESLPYPYLDPREYLAIEESHTNERFLRPFSIDRRYNWCLGTSYAGHPRYIPEDFVYHPNHRDYLYCSNDSGLAAHPNPLQAVELAIASRLKADAAMRTWYKTLPPYVLDPKSIPEHAQNSIGAWASMGYTLTISQLDTEICEVYLATIRGSAYPCFACGFGATLYGDTNQAILEALANAEANFDLYAGFCNGYESFSQFSIVAPLDHGLYYAQPKNAAKLDFLTERKEQSSPFRRTIGSFYDLAVKLNLTVCWLSVPGATYNVARVFSPYLVPISYGFGIDHSRHPALSRYSAPLCEERRRIPHCFYRP